MSADLKEAYNYNDRLGNGKITFKELENAIRCVGKLSTTAELKEYISELSKSDQDLFSFEDFSNVCEKVKRDLINGKDLVKRAFKVFDKDDDGFILSAELRQILTTLGEKLTEEEANELIKEADVEGTGRICYSDFVNSVTDFNA